eukprot:11202251-Karenia_brevis.AAC.1
MLPEAPRSEHITCCLRFCSVSHFQIALLLYFRFETVSASEDVGSWRCSRRAMLSAVEENLNS